MLSWVMDHTPPLPLCFSFLGSFYSTIEFPWCPAGWIWVFRKAMFSKFRSRCFWSLDPLLSRYIVILTFCSITSTILVGPLPSRLLIREKKRSACSQRWHKVLLMVHAAVFFGLGFWSQNDSTLVQFWHFFGSPTWLPSGSVSEHLLAGTSGLSRHFFFKKIVTMWFGKLLFPFTLPDVRNVEALCKLGKISQKCLTVYFLNLSQFDSFRINSIFPCCYPLATGTCR